MPDSNPKGTVISIWEDNEDFNVSNCDFKITMGSKITAAPDTQLPAPSTQVNIQRVSIFSKNRNFNTQDTNCEIITGSSIQYHWQSDNTDKKSEIQTDTASAVDKEGHSKSNDAKGSVSSASQTESQNSR